ncbi:MAG: hypothetical protein WA655_17090 [Candidatus Korobacteraceae bacterium]
MSARLTLLLLCDQVDTYAVFISALLAAGFQLLVGRTPEDAKELLAQVSADIVMILHDGVCDGSLVGAELKLIAPQTPIILITDGWLAPGPQLGIDSICHADPRDETLARGVATFFRMTLTKQTTRWQVRKSGEAIVSPIRNEPLLQA